MKITLRKRLLLRAMLSVLVFLLTWSITIVVDASVTLKDDLHSDPGNNQQFGWSVAVDGDTVVVGARSDDEGRGAVYVFNRSGDTWIKQAKLTPPDDQLGDAFGHSVAIDGETIVVGSPNTNTPVTTGATYVFTQNGSTWSNDYYQKLLPDDTAYWFGTSVDISGDTIVVGDWGNHKAYIFTNSEGTWTNQKIISEGTINFAYTVAIDGDTIAIGDPGYFTQGLVFIYTRNSGNWEYNYPLSANDGHISDNFGRVIAIEGSTMVVQAFDPYHPNSVYVFTLNGDTWTQGPKFTAVDSGKESPNDTDFGNSISISDDTFVVGDYHDSQVNNIDGAFYVFTRRCNEWTMDEKYLYGQNDEVGRDFGYSVAVDGNTIVVGAPNGDDYATYVYELGAPLPQDWDDDTYMSDVDCDDCNASVYPGATEVCYDGIDNDCDGLTDCNDTDCSDYIDCRSFLIITGVIDGPLYGGLPKAVEFYVLNDIADLSTYSFKFFNNGQGYVGPEFTFPGDTATAGDFIYVASEDETLNPGNPGFVSFFGFSPNYVSHPAASFNGDDAIELFKDGTVVDVFGQISYPVEILLPDGYSSVPWNYHDGWAYRVDGTGPDGSTFDLANWTFSGIDVLDGETTNDATTPFPIGTFKADTDRDGVYDPFDNCPTVPNADQIDDNDDGYGDACVAPDVVIPSTATVGYSPVIGVGTTINSGVIIGDFARIGVGVIINRDVQAGDGLTADDYSIVNQDAILCNNVTLNDNVIVDKGVVIGSYVTVGNSTWIGRNSIIGNSDCGTPSNVTIGQDVKIGMAVTVLPSTVIPDYTVIDKNLTVPPLP